ncbi:sugar ABC transporter ATP-binding protein (plasmid) [Rhizobium grahamii]|uniref:Sugar ABC transporter ATP-binding protein n=1 Tax=Rhizobium grahamii TaxID=1120045 RepID=A0A5Q0CCA3_9HYPH|nr:MULTISPECIES: sugar ABC transporter ATP-binding protein [Rhizobium]QFY63498.1 sugar ABC transporter ATP-binding protein [Rhizobium grahamii]QRM51739.1 sugar ABC transporter ATP-binding protein [Rhizobium sp. BG6]
MALLSLKEVTKSYGQVAVLKGIDLDVEPGEVLALVGENGAGKSTLMRIIAGLAQQTAGTASFDDVSAPTSLVGAEAAGIIMVHQEFCLAPHLTVAENVFLGREVRKGPFTDTKIMQRLAKESLARLGSSANPRAKLKDLPVSDWQLIELAKAFARNPRLVLMDEPTAVLSGTEAERLFERVREFRAAGGSVIFTSHRLDEVKEIADRVAVLRDGQIVRLERASQLSESQMAEAMVGRPLAEIFPAKCPPVNPVEVLGINNLASRGFVSEATLSVGQGEILGVAGLVGSGRTELFEAICGLRSATCVEFRLNGTVRKLPAAREAWQLGIAYLTEDRKAKGLLLGKPLAVNLALTSGALSGRTWIDKKAERAKLLDAVSAYDIRTGDIDTTAGSLSGGNQQKVLIAKTLASDPNVVIFDEPTRGVDIGAKQQIYKIIADLASRGKAIVVVSSEMQEVVGLAHRVVVMRKGKAVGELSGDGINEGEIIRLAMGVQEELDNVRYIGNARR